MDTILHGRAQGTEAPPPRADWTVPQGWESYTAAEHAIWQTLFNRQTKLLPAYACGDFVAGMRDLPLEADTIPDFRRVNDVLMPRTGWQIVAVPGLIPDDVFFEHLANRRFPAGNFIRTADQLDYLQEPDVFHDVFGHVPMLMHPVMADFICAYGQGGLDALARGVLPQLARVYWYSVEFGLVREDGGTRVFGAGIASSAAETVFSIDDASPNRIAFNLERVMRTRYRIDDFQEVYFVLDSIDDLLRFSEIDFAPFYERAVRGLDLEPGALLADDVLLHAGTGHYHHPNGRAGVPRTPIV